MRTCLPGCTYLRCFQKIRETGVHGDFPISALHIVGDLRMDSQLQESTSAETDQRFHVGVFANLRQSFKLDS